MRQPWSSQGDTMGEHGRVMNSNVKNDCRLTRGLLGING